MGNSEQFVKRSSPRESSFERLTVISSRTFDDVVGRFRSGIAHPDMPRLMEDIRSSTTPASLKETVSKALGSAEIMEFAQFDLGEVLRKELGAAAPRSLRVLIGNPLIMKEMVKRVPDAGSYAPVTVLIDQRPGGVHLSYDRMASLLERYQNAEALEVARQLDAKIEALLIDSAA
jgi:uncharacterized protein (DUF302 family)